MALKQHTIALCSLVLAALVSGCAAPKPGSIAPPRGSGSAQMPASASLVGTEWVAFAIDRVPEVLAPKPKVRWVSTDRVAGTGGCNGFSGRSVAVGETLRIGPLDSTGRACLSMPGSQEDLFFRAIELTRKARLERDQLILMDESGKELARLLKMN